MKISSTERETLADRGNLTRRTLVQSAAWSVPVIAAAAAAPLAAASADACIEQSVELTGVRFAWNDGDNGGNRTGIHLTLPSYDGNISMFADFTVRNDGNSAISGFEVIFNLTKDSWAVGSLVGSAGWPDGTRTLPTAVLPHRTNDGTLHLDSIPFYYDGVVLQPGQSVVFRLAWVTAPQPVGVYHKSGLYGIAVPRSIRCNDVDVPRSLGDETNRGNNDGRPVNDFYVGRR